MACLLTPFSFPRKHAYEEEDILILKRRELIIDGYHMMVYFSRNEYDRFHVNTVEISGRYVVFLPFYVVLKCASMFLGTEHLNFIQLMNNSLQGSIDCFSRRVYIWSQYCEEVPKPHPIFITGKNCEFENIEYKTLEAF